MLIGLKCPYSQMDAGVRGGRFMKQIENSAIMRCSDVTDVIDITRRHVGLGGTLSICIIYRV